MKIIMLFSSTPSRSPSTYRQRLVGRNHHVKNANVVVRHSGQVVVEEGQVLTRSNNRTEIRKKRVERTRLLERGRHAGNGVSANLG